MIFIIRPETNPYFNIAAEEYVVKHIKDDVVMLWQSEASVIVGKHQNALAEANLEYTSANKIPVIRRVSGGGTVYHDMGNINYTLIRTEANRERLIDFKAFTQPIVSFLKELGIKADFNGKNNLFIGDRKISGNAAHIHKKRVIHHGTLLFDSQLATLESSIQPTLKEIKDKAVKSVRSTVTNICDHLHTDMNSDAFKTAFQNYLIQYFKVDMVRTFSRDETKSISILAKEKYQSWEWTFGYSPNYSLHSVHNLHGQQATIKIEVEKGIIKSLLLEGNSDKAKKIEILLQSLIGLPHHPDTLDTNLRKITGQESEIKMIHNLLFGKNEKSTKTL